MAQPSSEHSYAELRRRGAGMCRGNRVQRCAELGLIEFAWVCSLGICLHLFELVWALQKFWVVSGHCSHWPGDKLPAIASKCRRGMVGRASHGWFMLAYLRVGCLHVWIHWRGCTPPAAYILGSTWKNIAGPSSSSSKSSKARLSTRNLCWRRHHRWLDFVVLGLWLCSWFVVQSRGRCEVWHPTGYNLVRRSFAMVSGRKPLDWHLPLHRLLARAFWLARCWRVWGITRYQQNLCSQTLPCCCLGYQAELWHGCNHRVGLVQLIEPLSSNASRLSS